MHQLVHQQRQNVLHRDHLPLRLLTVATEGNFASELFSWLKKVSFWNGSLIAFSSKKFSDLLLTLARSTHFTSGCLLNTAIRRLGAGRPSGADLQRCA